MGSSTGSISQLISLPKGGSALHAIGEKFSPDLFTGTGNFIVPIALPPLRNRFQPELNQVYSTGNRNGPFELGWAQNVTGDTRLTSKGDTRYRYPLYLRPRLFQMICSPSWDHISESPRIAIENRLFERPEVHLG